MTPTIAHLPPAIRACVESAGAADLARHTAEQELASAAVALAFAEAMAGHGDLGAELTAFAGKPHPRADGGGWRVVVSVPGALPLAGLFGVWLPRSSATDRPDRGRAELTAWVVYDPRNELDRFRPAELPAAVARGVADAWLMDGGSK